MFAAGAVAASIQRRDLATIQAAMASVDDTVTTLDQSIGSLSASSDINSAISDLVSKSQAVVSALNSGTTTVQGTSAVSLTDALSLVSSSNTLVNNVNKTVSDLIGKKDIISGAGQNGVVLDQLNAQKSAAQPFIAAIVSKVPSVVSGIANTQAQQVITALDNGITAFGGSVRRAFRMAA